MTDTIFALATAAGAAPLAVVRVSGSRAGESLMALTDRPLPPPRQAVRRTLRADGEVLDQALCLWFAPPASYTGEGLAEFHIHGSQAVIEAVCAALTSYARAAEPGEFTRRAVLNGKMTLTQAEGLADLITTESAGQRRLALSQLHPASTAAYQAWSETLTGLLAQAEAVLDFPDDEVVLLTGVMADRLDRLRDQIEAFLAHSIDGERWRAPLTAAVLGAPNVGKSSLVNRLAARPVAIISDQPGTTRDSLEARLDIAGYPVRLIDTAGLRDTDQPIERAGVARARQWQADSDLRLWVYSADQPPPSSAATARLKQSQGTDLFIVNKIDIAAAGSLAAWPEGFIEVSAYTGAGLKELTRALDRIITRAAPLAGTAVIARARHRAALTRTCEHLAAAKAAVDAVLCAEELRAANRAMGHMTGQVDIEAVLDEVFASFCIGK
ncbi:MAG: tRNA uridine-5-carboxymethylaminomethyl(34) synthesis GTPase MnmE [Pseudomonadota bacterium]